MLRTLPIALIGLTTTLCGCPAARQTPSADLSPPHVESAALACQQDSPEATGLVVALARCEGGRTCEQAWEDLSRLTDDLMLFRCDTLCGNGELLIDGTDYAPILAGRTVEGTSALQVGLRTDSGEEILAFLAAPTPAAAALAERLEGNERVVGIVRR